MCPGGPALVVAAIAAFIEAHADEQITLASLAAAVSLSPSHLQRAFTSAYGRSPKRYQTALRAEALKRGLRNGATVSAAGYDAGFGSTRGVYDPRPGASQESARKEVASEESGQESAQESEIQG